MTVVAIVLAAGRGRRLGQEAPKALLRAAGRSLLEWSARALGSAPGVDALQVVLPVGASETFEALRSGWSGPAALLEPIAGGATRQRSVALGLAAACRQLPDTRWVLVHDAARCLVEPADAEAVLEAAHPTGAALPVVPAGDTVKVLEGERVRETLDRGQLGLAQTPQAFRVEVLREALEKAERDGFEGTDCASLVERLGVEVRVCAGRPENWKVTHPGDLERAGALLAGRGSAP